MVSEPGGRGYDGLYDEFDSPLMRQIRREAYGEDIGQHSWVTAEELRRDLPRLDLAPGRRLLDLGCGPCGPLTFLAGLAGCRATGMDSSASAIAAGRARAVSLGLDGLVDLRTADLDGPLPFAAGAFDAAISLDVVIHLRDRARLFREVARVLAPRGRFLFTDAGVILGPVSSAEMELRAIHGRTQLVPPGFNERSLEQAGLRLIESEDRTESSLRNAMGRLAARAAHRAELEPVEGGARFEAQQRYLETVAGLARRAALCRVMYLAEARTEGPGGRP